jgi:hypothetical protein
MFYTLSHVELHLLYFSIDMFLGFFSSDEDNISLCDNLLLKKGVICLSRLIPVLRHRFLCI